MNMVQINWYLESGENKLAAESRCLYAYIDRRSNELVYIGKCWGTTVAERWNAPDKDETFDRIREAGTPQKYIDVSVGLILLPEGSRISFELVVDLESLLIFKEEPCGNIQNVQSCGAARRGLRVACSGDWPGAPLYIDPGPTP